MTVGWPDLMDELDRWGMVGRVAKLWWRDDDAEMVTPELDSLLRLAGGVPIALAVIPGLAHPELAAAVDGAPLVAVLQHGWSHANRALHGKKSEYPKERAPAEVAAEIDAGQARLKALFGPRFVPVLAPPWNRFADEFLTLLPANGVAGISTMVSPKGAALPPGLVKIDVHLDLVAWRADRGFIGTAAALGGLVGHLQAIRLGGVTPTGAIGILTHHLIMDGPTVAFLDQLTELTRTHAAVHWASAAELLQ
jgi:hypothetical protein